MPGSATTRIDESTAEGWVRDTVPLARALVNWYEPIVDEGVLIRAVPAAAEEGLYGPFMLSWFDSHTLEPTIYYLKEHTFYLRLASTCMGTALEDEELCWRALSDGSRMRIAITNDVLQVMAPVPPGRYSMVRHHALMVLVATLWLPTDQRDKWLQLYELSLEAARSDLELADDVGRLLAEVEDSAMKVFARGASRLSRAPIASLADLAKDDFEVITRYMLNCNAAVAVLAGCLERARRRGWSTEAWLAREIVRYRSDYYLLQDLDDVRSASHRRV